MEEEETYVGTSIVQEYTQPMHLFIEPLGEDLRCIIATITASQQSSPHHFITITTVTITSITIARCITITNKGAEQANLGGHKLSCTSEGGWRCIFASEQCRAVHLCI